MQSSELWAAWIVAAVMIGLVAWVGHIEARNAGLNGGLTPASEVARRSPVSLTRPRNDMEEPAAPRSGPIQPVVHPIGPASGEPPQVNLCLLDDVQRGIC
jgi:hypothetical protein